MSSLDVLIKRKSSRKISDANRNDIAQDSGIVIISDKLPENAEKIPSFVKDGGICWIRHQNENFECDRILPKELSNIKIIGKYKSVNGFEMEYIGPWITDRMHQLWHNPDFIDESDFVFWDFKSDKKDYQTAATHILFPKSKEWNIIGGFADYDVNLKDRAALIMEARYGKGLYLWTQILTPDKRGDKNKFATEGWKKLNKNLLNYFESWLENEKIKLKINKWAVKIGETINLELLAEEKNKIEKVTVDKIEFTEKSSQKYCAEYKPLKTGNCKFKVNILFKNGRMTSRYGFVKVSGKNTPFKFFTHTHFGHFCAPESLGVVSGACGKLNIDGVILSGGLFYKDDKMYQAISDYEIKMIDTPLVRIFPGEELHCMHQYSEKEGVREDNPDRRRHASTIGCWNLYPYDNDRWQAENLIKIHDAEGLAVICHPYMDDWWLSPQKGHNFEAVEFDRCDTSLWDNALLKGELVTGVSGIDNAAGVQWLPLRGSNTGWFDEAFSLKSIFNIVLQGKITKFNSYPLPFEALDSYLWFDVNSVPCGGTVYAVDKVNIHIKIKSHLPIQQIYIVKNGKRNYMNIEPNRCELNLNIEDEIDSDGYYRIEVNHDKLYAPYCVGSLSNPVFVKKINGPGNGCFSFENDAKPVFDDAKKRWTMPSVIVKDVKYENNLWNISFFNPGETCLFSVNAESGLEKYQKKNTLISGKGEHEIEIVARASGAR